MCGCGAMEERRWKLTEPSRRKAMEQAWAVVKTLTGDWELVIRPFKSKRSVDQNRRYWKLLREVSAVVWLDGRQYSDAVWHEWFKRTFIGCEELPDGDVKGISSTTLSVEQFGEYMTQIEAWCAEQGYQVMEAA